MDSRRFSRSKNAYICGVCAGLAEYTGMNVTLMRVLWVLLAVASWVGGLALVAYIVLAFVMAPPEGAPQSDRFWHNIQGRNVMMIAALVLICTGIYIMVQEILHINIQQYLFPVALVIGGGLLMAFAFGNNKKQQ